MRGMIRPNYIDDPTLVGNAVLIERQAYAYGYATNEDEGCDCGACDACYERAENNEVEAEIDRVEEEK